MAPAPQQEVEGGFGKLVNDELAAGLHSMGIISPNAIQADAIPLALSGSDMMVCAQTGSGKTLMFLLPMLQKLMEQRQPPNPASPCQAVAVAPTDTLAGQVATVAQQLTAGIPGLAERLVVATPQRLLELVEQGAVRLGEVRMFAIDEADAVLCTDDETAQCVNRILAKLEARQEPPQFLLAMAHLTKAREAELVGRFPHAQRVGHTGVLVPTLRQCFHYFRDDKEAKLVSVLRKAEEDQWMSSGTTLVFCAGSQETQNLSNSIRAALPGLNPMALSLDSPPEDRASALDQFRAGEVRLLVTTDTAARGLDFPLLRHVVMYDVPKDLTSFVHCVGRTARRGQSGLVTCLVQTSEAQLYQFDFQSHHGLQPGPQLSFQQRPTTAAAAAPAPAGAEAKSTQAKRQAKGLAKERRVDPADGGKYTLAEIRRFYRQQYSEPEIQRYWREKCQSFSAEQ